MNQKTSQKTRTAGQKSMRHIWQWNPKAGRVVCLRRGCERFKNFSSIRDGCLKKWKEV